MPPEPLQSEMMTLLEMVYLVSYGPEPVGVCREMADAEALKADMISRGANAAKLTGALVPVIARRGR